MRHRLAGAVKPRPAPICWGSRRVSLDSSDLASMSSPGGGCDTTCWSSGDSRSGPLAGYSGTGAGTYGPRGIVSGWTGCLRCTGIGIRTPIFATTICIPDICQALISSQFPLCQCNFTFLQGAHVVSPRNPKVLENVQHLLALYAKLLGHLVDSLFHHPDSPSIASFFCLHRDPLFQRFKYRLCEARIGNCNT